MSLQRWTDSDDEFFANPFRALLNPRVFGPSLLTAPNASLNAPTPIKVDVVEVKTDHIMYLRMNTTTSSRDLAREGGIPLSMSLALREILKEIGNQFIVVLIIVSIVREDTLLTSISTKGQSWKQTPLHMPSLRTSLMGMP